MPKISYISGAVTRKTFDKKCKDEQLDPKLVVFIFPSNKDHHKPGTGLHTLKGGGGLAQAAHDIGKADYPTLA